MEKLLNFLMTFGDRIHNVKEENHLFPLLVENGVPQEGLIKEMLLDHEAEREFIAGILGRMGRSLPTLTDSLSLSGQLQDYIRRKRVHIQLENEQLYPHASGIIGKAGAGKLVADFAKVEERSLYPNAVRHFSNLLAQWESD